MKIQTNAFVAIEYTLTDKAGEVLDQTPPGEPVGFVYGAGMIIPGLEKKLAGLGAGDSTKVVVAAADAYGEVRPELFHEVPRSQFPPQLDIEPGMRFGTQTPYGVQPAVVSAVKDDVVVIDMNHPLAGTDLYFDVTIAEVREATADDLAPASCCDDAQGCGSCGGC